MREILFRGKRVDNGKWVEGDLSQFLARAFIGKKAVDPETIGQYTDLRDKNGEKIFEGDVVKSKNFNESVVNFKDGCFYACDTLLDQKYDGVYYDNVWEIVGNIHDKEE